METQKKYSHSISIMPYITEVLESAVWRFELKPLIIATDYNAVLKKIKRTYADHHGNKKTITAVTFKCLELNNLTLHEDVTSIEVIDLPCHVDLHIQYIPNKQCLETK